MKKKKLETQTIKILNDGEIFNKINPEEIKLHEKDLKKNGYTILKHYVKENTLNIFKNKIQRLSNIIDEDPFNTRNLSLPVGEQREALKNDLFINHLPIYDPIFIRLGTRGDHINILSKILNDKFYKLIPEYLPNFNLSQLNARKAFNPLNWHNDVRFQFKGQSTFSIMSFLAFEEMTKENGTLLVIPESHKYGTYPNIINEELSIELKLSAGDLVLIDSRIHHATSQANGIESPWTILFQYRSWWLKPAFDFWRYFKNNKLCIRNLSPVERAILGENSEAPFDPRESTSARKPLNY